MRKVASYLVTLLLVASAIVGCQQEPPLPILGLRNVDQNGVEQVHKVATFSFTDQRNVAYSSTAKDKDIIVMNYFFTSCPTICPKMTDNIYAVFKHFQGAREVEFVSASVDPVRDDPKRLQLFMASHNIPLNENWHFLTGDKKSLYDFARYQLYLSALEDVENVEEDFIHSEKVVLIDQQRRIRGYYSGIDDKEMVRLDRDIRRLLKEGK